VHGPHRSLYANIGAALHFRKDLLNLKFSAVPTDPIVFYIEGYFVSEKIDVCRHIFETYCKGSSNILATNLNARYILDTFGQDMKFLVENSTLVFGNRKEFQKLAELYGFDDIDRTARHLLQRSGAIKFLVITNGENSVELFSGNREHFEKAEYKVPEVPKGSIVDTTGAGDGFVAGFLFKYVRKKKLSDCVAYGNEISGKVVKTIGCNLPV
jgi:adenosine kinase